MNFPSELRKAKQVIREWIRTHFSDEKLASVATFNEDGKMGFRNPCGCLLGVTYSDPLHLGHDCNHDVGVACVAIDYPDVVLSAIEEEDEVKR